MENKISQRPWTNFWYEDPKKNNRKIDPSQIIDIWEDTNIISLLIIKIVYSLSFLTTDKLQENIFPDYYSALKS